jgi:mono/diheme cytochrome c family protein
VFLTVWLTTGVVESRTAGQAATAPTSTVWDGVYTDAQATAGQRVYLDHCSNCHGAGLEGADQTPGLVGGVFGANWNGLTVGDLSERIRVTMPADMPGRLSRQEVADVMAFLIKSNRWPSGTTPLPTALALQKQITIQSIKP